MIFAPFALAETVAVASPSTEPIPRVCGGTHGIAAGPVAISFLESDLGAPRRLCPRTEVSLGGGGFAVVDTAAFYGHIAAGGNLQGSWAASSDTEIYASIEFLRYETVITPIPAEFLGFGHVGVGASHRLWTSGDLGVGAHVRTVWPTAIGLYQNAYPVGLDLGLSGVWAPADTFEVHADVGGVGGAAISAGPAYPRAGLRATVGAAWQPVRPFAVVLDLASGFGYADAVDHVAGGIAFRGAFGERVGVELGAMVPFAGRERALAAAELRVDVRLD